MIAHVSDTARWVAMDRAVESERPDALFRDPYARRLAGPEGAAIVATLGPGGAAVRTAVFDGLVLATIAQGDVDLVLNLAAGLDARPWRLALPPALRWVDVDLPAILDYKTAQMAGEAPRCRYETIAADLTDDTTRRALLARIGGEASRVLVITEGLLVYLPADRVAALARDLAAHPSVRWWLCDLWSPEQLRWSLRDRSGRVAAAGNATFQFAPVGGPDFFAPLGWQIALYRSPMQDTQLARREEWPQRIWRWLGRLLGPALRREQHRMSGSYLLLRRQLP